MFIYKTTTPGPFVPALQALVVGLQNSVPPAFTQIALGGKVVSLWDLQTELEGYLTTYKAAEAAATAYQNALQAREAIAHAAVARYAAVRAAMKVALGRSSPDLVKFGVSPDKARDEGTVEEKRERVAKAKATRLARGTKGKKQKEAIKGSLQPVTAEPAATAGTAPVAAHTGA